MAWTRCEAFLRIAQSAYRSRTGLQPDVTMPGLLGPSFRERLSAAMRIPVVETLFPKPWTAAARRVLPSPSPQMTATAMWAPIIAWCALETLADSINAQKSEEIALDLFDRLRLRQPLAESFNASDSKAKPDGALLRGSRLYYWPKPKQSSMHLRSMRLPLQRRRARKGSLRMPSSRVNPGRALLNKSFNPRPQKMLRLRSRRNQSSQGFRASSGLIRTFAG